MLYPSRSKASLFSLTLILLLMLLIPHRCHGFSLERMCETRCYYGRGGNLCNCNAFHFAGKRNSQSAPGASHPLLELDFENVKDTDSERDSDYAGRSTADSSSSLEGKSLESGEGMGLGGMEEENQDGEDVLVGGFFGVEGNEKSAVRRLVSILKAAVDERLIDSYKEPRKWRQSSVPFPADGFVY